MKTFCKSILVLLLALAAFTLPAADFKSQSFINTSASYPLVLTNTGVFTYGYTNAYTNAAGITVTNTSMIVDVGNWAYKNGEPQANANVTFRLVGTAATLTNTITAVFARVGDGVNAATSSGSQWSVGITPNGTTEVVVCTNVPSYMLTGNAKIRLLTLTSGSGNTNALFKAITFNGFLP